MSPEVNKAKKTKAKDEEDGFRESIAALFRDVRNHRQRLADSRQMNAETLQRELVDTVLSLHEDAVAFLLGVYEAGEENYQEVHDRIDEVEGEIDDITTEFDVQLQDYEKARELLSEGVKISVGDEVTWSDWCKRVSEFLEQSEKLESSADDVNDAVNDDGEDSQAAEEEG